MDYQALLAKYMRYLQDIEGADFVTDYSKRLSSVEFTPEEWKALEEAAIKD